ncbi:WD40/YVTN/BNR-like repeat-containing protein [Caldisericum exile]|nr:hypothetical protein [Caldisericum exile]
MLRKKLMVSIFVILILSVYAGCSRTEGILPQNNPQSEIPNQEVEIKNSEKEQFVPWEISHWERINDGIVTAFAIDPKDSNILYAATYPPQKVDSSSKVQVIGNAKTSLWKSEDSGKHWSILLSLENLRYGPLTIDGIYIDPECSRKIWISEHGAGLLFSSDGGITWKKDLQKDENDIFRMYWNSLNTNINDLPVAYSVRFGDVNRWTGAIYSSLDSGKTWKRTSLPPLACPSFTLAVDKKNPNIFYVFGLNGLFKRVEGKGDYEYYPIGDSLNTSYIYIEPKNPNSLYAVSYSYYNSFTGFNNSFASFKSSDYGKTWEKVGDFYFNPLHPDIRIKIVITKTTPPSRKLLYVSLDNGKSWKLSDLDIDKNGIHSISIGGEGVIYADTYNGLFRSEDKGLHWSQITNFKEDYWEVTDGNSCFNSKVLVSPDDPNTIYWTTEFLKSTDGGKTWQEMDIIQHSKRIHGSAIAIDPHNHNLAYLGITGTGYIEPLSPEESAKQGIYRSNDGGKNWKKISLDGYRISAIVISPTTGIIYAGTFFNGLFRSKDSGKSWERITLDNDLHLSVSSLAIDTKNNIVYIGVLGGGIFKIEDKE